MTWPERILVTLLAVGGLAVLVAVGIIALKGL